MPKKSDTAAPACIGIIMDGNRRWAKARNLTPLDGHKAGYEKFREVIPWAKDAGVQHLMFYALSTENWKRSAAEVSGLLELMRHALSHGLRDIKKESVRLRFAGDLDRFPADIRNAMQGAEHSTSTHSSGTVTLAVSYGGRSEILSAVEKLCAKGADGKISEETFERHLWTAGVPDPDLIIRTGGEKRLSGFLPWQSVYSELFFIDTLWPDFSKSEFDSILNEYSDRSRRYGA